MTAPIKPMRPTCARCLRPQTACICHWITPIENAVEVLILQHPLEVDSAKGSARLLHLILVNSRMVTGEAFAEQALRALLCAPLPGEAETHAASGAPLKHTVLLYPDTPSANTVGISAPPPLDQDLLHDPARLRLVVLDGTWRKSRKMLYLNPLLQNLPRLPLREPPASHYRIRKAHRPDQLSTLEATCYGLMQLEGGDEKYRPLLNAFDGFVDQQLGYRAAEKKV